MNKQRIPENRLARTVAAGLAMATAGVPAHADAELETITVYARRLQPATRVAATVTVIDQERLARTLATDVEDVVRYEPGLSVRSDPFRFGSESIAVRGVGGNRVAVEVDGVPAAAGFSVGSFADSGRGYLDPAFIERIEVLRGPASSLYGSDAIGGVVAIASVTSERIVADGDTYGLRTQVGATSDDDGRHAGLIGAGALGSVTALVGYQRREGHELDTAADVTPNPVDYRSDAWLAKLAWADAPGGPVTLSGEWSDVEQQTDVEAFLLLAGSRFANTTRLEGDDEAGRRQFVVSQQLDGRGVFDTADWRVYVQRSDTRQDTYEERRAAPPRTPALAIERSFELEDRTWGVEFTAVREFGGERLEQTLVYGFEATQSRLEEQRDGLQTDRSTGNSTNVILGEAFPLRDFPVSDVTRVGVFVQDELRFGAWTVIPALRADYYRLDPQPDALYREDNPNTGAVGIDDHSFAPKLGVTRAFTPELTGFAQYAHGFRAPPPEDVNIGLDLPQFNVRAIPNPDLEPETSDGYELGLRWRSASVSLTASAFLTRYEDFIESKVNLGPDPATGVVLFQSQNIASAEIYGAELALDWRAGDWKPALAGWTGRLAAAWAQGEDLDRNEPINSVDPASATLGIGYTAPSGRWGGDVVTTVVAEKRNVDSSRVELYRADGYVTLDLLARVELGRGVRLNAGFFNLTDEAYVEWADVRGRPVGDPLLPYYTRPGRNASVTLQWAFGGG